MLPLKWLSFIAQNQNGNVLLQWSTSSEINTNNFAIEHSINGKDWNEIGIVLSKNNSATNNYSYPDFSPSTGVNYYRIRQNDNDGKYGYSKIVSIDVREGAKSFRLISNPVINKSLQFEIISSSSLVITLINNEGKIVWKKGFSAGIHSISLTELSKGAYYLKAGNQSEKLLVE